MGQSLYNIQEEYQRLADFLLSTGGELTPDIEQALAINKEELQNKAVNYGFVIKQMEAENGIIDSEIARLTENKKRRVKAIERLENNLVGAMRHFGIPKVEQPGLLTLSLRKSEACEIEDESAIPPRFIKVKIVEPIKSVDKTAIKAAIKSGEQVPGARIQEHQNLQIK
jgi:hypothetical protein